MAGTDSVHTFGNVSDTLAFFFIAFWRSPVPLWLNTGWKSRWSITVSKCNQYRFLPANVWRITQYAVEKLADKSEINALQAS